MYYFYGKINWGHVVCPLYGGDPYLRESVMKGSTVNCSIKYCIQSSRKFLPGENFCHLPPLVKILSAKRFCNTKVAELHKIFSKIVGGIKLEV